MEPVWITFFQKKENILLISYLNNQITGFLYGFILDRLERKNSMLFLYSIDVLPEFRKQGFGKMLIEELKRIGNENDIMKKFV